MIGLYIKIYTAKDATPYKLSSQILNRIKGTDIPNIKRIK